MIESENAKLKEIYPTLKGQVDPKSQYGHWTAASYDQNYQPAVYTSASSILNK
uniref:Uncharacterized protein n=1 Tax=viral metagenome TaxID=1070528 RepID=A0A6H1Z8C9_9ZZZZ